MPLEICMKKIDGINPMDRERDEERMNEKEVKFPGKYRQERAERARKSEILMAKINNQKTAGNFGDSNQAQHQMISIMKEKEWTLPGDVEKYELSSMVSESAKWDKEERARLRILDQLRFGSMEAKFKRIPESYKQTFDWISNDSPSSGTTKLNNEEYPDSGNIQQQQAALMTPISPRAYKK
jgi:hypothetical protein